MGRRRPAAAPGPAGRLDGPGHHQRPWRRLSQCLRLSREDRGDDRGMLGRPDILAFTSRLAHLQRTGQMTFRTGCGSLRRVFRFLGDLHVLGMTGPGQPAAGLPAAFALRRDDIPGDPERDGPPAQPAARRAAGDRRRTCTCSRNGAGFPSGGSPSCSSTPAGAPMRSAPWRGTASSATPQAARC